MIYELIFTENTQKMSSLCSESSNESNVDDSLIVSKTLPKIFGVPLHITVPLYEGKMGTYKLVRNFEGDVKVCNSGSSFWFDIVEIDVSMFWLIVPVGKNKVHIYDLEGCPLAATSENLLYVSYRTPFEFEISEHEGIFYINFELGEGIVSRDVYASSSVGTEVIFKTISGTVGISPYLLVKPSSFSLLISLRIIGAGFEASKEDIVPRNAVRIHYRGKAVGITLDTEYARKALPRGEYCRLLFFNLGNDDIYRTDWFLV